MAEQAMDVTTVFPKNRVKLWSNGVVIGEYNQCDEIQTATPIPSIPVPSLPVDELLQNTIPDKESFRSMIIPKEEPLDDVLPKEEPFDGVPPKDEPFDGVPPNDPLGTVLPKEEPLDNGTVVESQLGSQKQDLNEPEIDIDITNVVCCFSVGCHLNLRQIALSAANVEYRRENGMVSMKLRRPSITASIWSSGKIMCKGANSDDAARRGARRIARIIQKLGFRVKIRKISVVNVLGTCSMPFEIKINAFSQHHREAEYEPELHPGVTYKIKNLKATLKIFSTGSITVTAPSVSNVQLAIEQIYPLVFQFRKEFTNREEMLRKRCLMEERRIERKRQKMV